MDNNNKEADVALTQEQRDFIENLINENQTTIKAIIRATLGAVNRYLFEDCVGELYLLLCKKATFLQQHPAPNAWIFVATKLTTYDVMKSHKNDLKNVPLMVADKDLSDVTYEEAIYNIWTKDNAGKNLLDQLTKKEALVYNKLFVEMKSTKEVANELGVSESTVRSFKKMIKDKVQMIIDEKI